MKHNSYDVVIIGGGPSGFTCAIYCARAGLSTLLIEKYTVGGQMATTSLIENYPGFEVGIDGYELAQKMKKGAENSGAEIESAKVTAVDLKNDIKTVTTTNGDVTAKVVVIATGASPRKIGLDEETELTGKGVGYCATCDGMFYKGKDVAVIGGGNSAAAEAIYLSKICNKVYLIHRRDSLRASKSYLDPLKEAHNIEFVWNSKVEKILSENVVTGLKLKNIKTDETNQIKLQGVFVAIGREPETEIFKGQVELDDKGFIVADESTKTNIDGVFAIGDVRTKALRQIVTAAGDGATASHFAEEYLRS